MLTITLNNRSLSKVDECEVSEYPQTFSIVHCKSLYTCSQLSLQDEEMAGGKEIEYGHASCELCV